MNKKKLGVMAAFMGCLFLTAYIRSATVDVVYTDYIRIVNSYLENVFSPKPYLHADILTRIPINYPQRVVNVLLFGYSTTFDMLLGVLGLTASAVLILGYAARQKLTAAVFMVLFILLFALDKWEMLTNGTGWVHFWAFFCFYYHYYIYDRVRSGNGKRNDERMLYILPSVTILLISGPYCAIYAGTMFAVYTLDMWTERKADDVCCLRSRYIRRMVCMAVPFLLFVTSRAFSTEEYAGATEMSLKEVMLKSPMLIPKMAVKSFSSMIIGGESAVQLKIPEALLLIMGLFVVAAYVYALVLNFTSGLYRKQAFPLMMLISGLISHGIVLLSRWIFLDDMYMMSSRYALQFQSGIIGILLTFAMVRERTKEKSAGRSHKAMKAAAAVFLVIIAAGRLVTTGREIGMAPYRKEAFVNMQNVALNYENESDETIKQVLQYHSPGKTRQALRLLEDKKLNVFREKTDGQRVPER